MSFRVFATGAILTCFAHILLRPQEKTQKNKQPETAAGDAPLEEIQYEFPQDQKTIESV